MQHKDNLIWIDLEMTGLRTDQDSIIEIATVVTNSQLEVLAEGPVLAIATAEVLLAGMDEWNTRQHGASGLVTRIRASEVSLAQAEAATLVFLKQWVPGGVSPMCGNSICQDRRFLARQMPQLERYFHYRNLDVSTVKELARRWAPQVSAQIHQGSHAPGIGGHPRLHPRTAILSRAAVRRYRQASGASERTADYSRSVN